MIGFSPVVVDLLLDSGSDVPAISQEFVTKIQRERPHIELTGPLERRARVVTAFDNQKEIDTKCTAWIFSWVLEEEPWVLEAREMEIDHRPHLTVKVFRIVREGH